MGWVEGIQRAIAYMEGHLLEEVSIEEIAREAHSSAFHFQRTFSLLTDISVGEYMRRRRLTLAAEDLTGSDIKIIDLALKYGYDTPESFSKAFKKQHGIKPSEARKNARNLKSYNRLTIQVSIKGAEPMNYKIVEKESFQVVGLRRPFSVKNGENLSGIPAFWNEVNGNKTDATLFQLNDGMVKGVLGVCDTKEDSPLMDYWIATAHEGEAPDSFESLEIPASKWAIFEVRGPMPDAMQNTWKKIIQEWFPSNSYRHAGTPELEVYTDEDPASPNLYSEIWIPVK
ncbi:AraC family transcriptional regulator [Priestia koreensis]|uniref:AraC family transcriptional regulator n=1 Tax=Priestia koreensis TaxID=284581 RepID=UPI0034577C72